MEGENPNSSTPLEEPDQDKSDVSELKENGVVKKPYLQRNALFNFAPQILCLRDGRIDMVENSG